MREYLIHAYEDFIFVFEDFTEGLFWYVVEAVAFLAEEAIAFYLVVASQVLDYIRFFFCNFRALISFEIKEY